MSLFSVKLDGRGVMNLPLTYKSIYIPLGDQVIKLIIPEDLASRDDIEEYPLTKSVKEKLKRVSTSIENGIINKRIATWFAEIIRKYSTWLAIKYMIEFGKHIFDPEDKVLHNCLVLARYAISLRTLIEKDILPPKVIKKLYLATKKVKLLKPIPVVVKEKINKNT